MTITLISDCTARAMLRAAGGMDICGPRGAFVGIFNKPHFASGDIPVDDAAPTIEAVTADLVAAGVAGDTALTIDGEIYIVRSVQPDGTGMTVLLLEGP